MPLVFQNERTNRFFFNLSEPPNMGRIMSVAIPSGFNPAECIQTISVILSTADKNNNNKRKNCTYKTGMNIQTNTYSRVAQTHTTDLHDHHFLPPFPSHSACMHLRY